MTAQRIKSRTLLAVALCAIAVMVGWSQPWATLVLVTGISGGDPVSVSGQTMVPGLSALALTSLALLAALALAGLWFRRVLGVVQAILGVVVVATAWGACVDPVAAASPALVEITGIQDIPALRELVTSSELTFWPVVTIVVGILTLLSGAATLIWATRWPVSGRKYSATSGSSITPGALSNQTDVDSSHARIDAWDDMSRGADPTA
jgi:uncharacterized membrane protein (TIGR02234 family)